MDPTVLADPRAAVGVEGQPPSPAEGGSLNSTEPSPPHPTIMRLCPLMVAARLMTLLWPGPHITQEEMPGTQRCFLRTLQCVQQSDPHVVKQACTILG